MRARRKRFLLQARAIRRRDKGHEQRRDRWGSRTESGLSAPRATDREPAAELSAEETMAGPLPRGLLCS